MKWFKHENTFNNPKIEILTESYGLVGYGFYFSILELIASHIEPDNQDEWGYLPKEYSPAYLCKKLRISEEDFTKMLLTCIELGLLQKKGDFIFCPKILERADDYTTRLVKQTPNKLRTNSEQSSTNSEQTPNKVGQTSSRIEENRIEKNRIEEKREKPQNSLEYLKTIPISDIEEFAEILEVSRPQITNKSMQLYNYCKAHGKKYKDYKALLWNSLRKDFKQRVKTIAIVENMTQLSEKERNNNFKRLADLRKHLDFPIPSQE